MEVQERKNSTSKEVEDYKYENQTFLNNMNKEIQEGKKEHIDLSNEVCIFYYGGVGMK